MPPLEFVGPVLFQKPLADTTFNRRSAAGHYHRLGHQLNAVQVSADGELWTRVNLCCGEEVPADVPSFKEF